RIRPKPWGDLRQQRLERVDRCDSDRGTDSRSRRASARSAARRVNRVADFRLDVADRNAERVRGNHRDQRACAGAKILRSAANDDRAVRGDLNVCATLTPAPTPRVYGDAHTGLDRTRGRITGRMSLVPPEFLRTLLEVRTPHRVGR